MIQREGAGIKSAKTDDYQNESVLEQKVHLTHCSLLFHLMVEVFFHVTLGLKCEYSVFLIHIKPKIDSLVFCTHRRDVDNR